MEIALSNKYQNIMSQFINAHNRDLTDEEVKRLSLLILDEVDAFCKDHNIHYSLAYGTLIGAVRHQGYIPWDDDIDIMMLRSDYEKFVTLFNNTEDGVFSVASYETDRSIIYPFAKVVCNLTIHEEGGYSCYGHGIDLFPIDKIPSNKTEAQRILKRQNIYWHLLMLKSMKWEKKRGLLKNLIMAICKTFLFFVSYARINKLMRKDVNKYSKLKDNYYMGCLFGPYGIKEFMNKDCFNKVVLMEFEKRQYYCLKNYDEYLSSLYGNYMQLPPEDKRVTHHNFRTRWK